MGTARAAAVVLALSGAASAQQISQIFPCADLVERFPEQAGAKPVFGPVARVGRILQRLLDEEAAGVKKRRVVHGVAKSNEMIAHGTPEEVGVVRSALEQLRQDPLPRARLQVTLLTMPAALVKAHELKDDAVVPGDEAVFAKLVRDAVKQAGTLQNLPEVIAEPLAPFVAEPAARPGTPAPADDATLRLRGEMVPLQPGELGFAVQLVRGALPADRTVLPKEMLLHRAFRLEAGKAVMVVTVAQDTATVVMVRCLEIASEAPKKADAGR